MPNNITDMTLEEIVEMLRDETLERNSRGQLPGGRTGHVDMSDAAELGVNIYQTVSGEHYNILLQLGGELLEQTGGLPIVGDTLRTTGEGMIDGVKKSYNIHPVDTPILKDDTSKQEIIR